MKESDKIHVRALLTHALYFARQDLELKLKILYEIQVNKLTSDDVIFCKDKLSAKNHMLMEQLYRYQTAPKTFKIFVRSTKKEKRFDTDDTIKGFSIEQAAKEAAKIYAPLLVSLEQIE